MKDWPSRKWFISDAALCIFIVCIVFHLCFKGQWAFNVAPQNDDGCYLSILYRLLGQSTEGFCDSRPNYFSPGTSFLWLPAGLLALPLSWLSGLRLYHWIQPFVGILSFSFFGFALYFLFRDLREFGDARMKRIWLWALAILLNAPILYYATHWVIMPHTAQILLAFATICFLDRERFVPAGIAGFLLALTRFNDIPVVLLFVGKAIDLHRKNRGETFFSRKNPIAWGVAALLAAAFVGIAQLVLFGQYGPLHLISVFLDLSPAKAKFFFLHDRWGILWMSFWWVAALFLGAVFFFRLSYFEKSAWIWLLAETIVTTAWAGNGGDFGYRYLIGSYAAAWVVWRGLVKMPKPNLWPIFRITTFTNAAWMTYLYFAYRSVPELSPAWVSASDGSKVLGGLSHFQIEAFKHFFDPEMYRIAFAQRLPLLTLWRSFQFEGEQPDPSDWVVIGVDQLVLALVALGTLFYILVFIRRRYFGEKG